MTSSLMIYESFQLYSPQAEQSLQLELWWFDPSSVWCEPMTERFNNLLCKYTLNINVSWRNAEPGWFLKRDNGDNSDLCGSPLPLQSLAQRWMQTRAFGERRLPRNRHNPSPFSWCRALSASLHATSHLSLLLLSSAWLDQRRQKFLLLP